MGRKAKCHKLSRLRIGESAAKFGDCFAYTEAMPNRANQARGKQNGQENLEEVEEDRSNEAADG
jgi:hypothetical protein